MMSDGEPRLRVLVADERGRRVPANGLVSWLRRVVPVRARGTVSIALVSDDRIRALNRTYRGTDSATDVLSFSYDDQSFLGDIVIARGVAKRQAREAGHSEATEIRVLALHVLLHLLGYDHERDAGRMRRVEERLRRKGGLRGGLIERARPSTGSGRARKKSARDKRVQTNARGELVEPRAIPR